MMSMGRLAIATLASPEKNVTVSAPKSLLSSVIKCRRNCVGPVRLIKGKLTAFSTSWYQPGASLTAVNLPTLFFEAAAWESIICRATGREMSPGQSVQFLFTRGVPGVHAWELAEGLNPDRLDVKRYCALLDRAMRTVLDPFASTNTLPRLL